MAYRDSTTASGASATPAVAVPTGVAADDIVILAATIDSTAAAFDSGDLPTGFVEMVELDLTGDGQTTWVGYKRLTGSDAGSYTFGNVGGSADWVCQAIAFSGRHTTNNPEISSNSVSNAANASPVTVTANGVTAVAGDDLLWISIPDNRAGQGGTHTPPSSPAYSEKEDAQNGWAVLSLATKENDAGGATGTVAGVLTLTTSTSGWAAWIVRIPEAGGGGGVVVKTLAAMGVG
jgi:hypothetical protein